MKKDITRKEKARNVLAMLGRCLCACLLWGGGSLLFTACGDDDPTPGFEPEITIVESDLLFEPQGRTGHIEVRASGDLTTELPYDWCTATVAGNVISVTVDDNPTFEGRTALLTIRAGGASRQVPVQQRGMALGSIPVEALHAANAGNHFAYYVRHDLPMTLQADEDWVHARMEGDSLFIDVDRNSANSIRRATLHYECAGYEGECLISQYDMKYILGEYYLGGDMLGTPTGFRIKLVEQEGKLYMIFFRVENWKDQLLPVDFDEGRCELTLHSATLIHQTDNSNYDVMYFFDDNGNVATVSSATMKASIYFNPFVGSHYATLEDTGSWSRGQLTGLIIYMVRPLITSTAVQLTNPYLVWLGPGTEE